MSRLHLILGDQLSLSVSALRDLNPERDIVLMAEVRDESVYVAHHPQKIALILSAMRHFAQTLTAARIKVDYIHFDDPDNTHSLTGEVARAIERHGVTKIVLTEPGE